VTRAELGAALAGRVTSVLWLPLLLVGCGASSPSALTFPSCFSVTELTTTSVDGTPAFRWSPTCHIGSLVVTDEQTGLVQWQFYGPFLSSQHEIEGILPVVAYGVLPSNATELVHAADLVAGSSYRVAIFSMTQAPGEDAIFLKSTVFQF